MGTYYHRHCLYIILCEPAVFTCTHAKCRSHAFPFHRSEADRLHYTYRFQTHIQFQDTLKPYYQHQQHQWTESMFKTHDKESRLSALRGPALCSCRWRSRGAFPESVAGLASASPHGRSAGLHQSSAGSLVFIARRCTCEAAHPRLTGPNHKYIYIYRALRIPWTGLIAP